MMSKQELWGDLVIARLRAGYSWGNAVADADDVLAEFRKRFDIASWASPAQRVISLATRNSAQSTI